MSDLTGSIWRNRRNRSRYVRVIQHGEKHAQVWACSPEGKPSMTFRGGQLRAQESWVRLHKDGLSGYERVEVAR